jgi:hypothetical protein
MGIQVWGPAKTTRRQPVKSVYANLRTWNKASDPANPAKMFVGSLMDWAEDHPDADILRPAMWDAIGRMTGLFSRCSPNAPNGSRHYCQCSGMKSNIGFGSA